ncbi:MAG: carotenoid oxygenase family protein [Myxococcota bacterium]
MPNTQPWASVPRSLLRADRRELTNLPLKVLEGTIPPDLAGHVFMVAPVGTVESQGLPDPAGNTVMNGDGLILRFDCANGEVGVTTRLARTPDLIADEATAGSGLPLSFFSSGIARVSPLLGVRDFANTAFLPMRRGDETRLLLTYDAGRPVEIDPLSLRVVTPVGAYSEWQACTFEDLPFPLVLSPAHPAYDPATGELFTANYGRSAASFLSTIPFFRRFSAIPIFAAAAVEHAADAVGMGARTRRFLRGAGQRLRRFENRVNDAIGKVPNVPEDFTDAVVWDGDGPLRRFRMYDRVTGLRVEIRQSIHQVAVTRNYVVFLDTGFKIGADQGFNDPAPRAGFVDRALRASLTTPQDPNTVLWIVARADLAKTATEGIPEVKATRVEFPLEADHFVADYEDDDGVTVHVAHANATDLSEWVRDYDRSAFNDAPAPNDLRGMLAVGAMDLNRLGRYTIDPIDGTVTDARLVAKDDCTWALALYAGRGLLTPEDNPNRVRQIYWASEGFFIELLTEFVYELYADYRHRLTPIEELLNMKEAGGRPSSIFRLDTGEMRVADRLRLPASHMVGSMQFIPRARSGSENGAESPASDAREDASSETDGYLMCTIYSPERVEVWVLDAANLAGGPLCRLHHPELVVGFSLHSAWLPDISPRDAAYRVTAKEDFPDLDQYRSDAKKILLERVIPEFYGDD